MSDALIARLQGTGIEVQTISIQLDSDDAATSGSGAVSAARDGFSSVVPANAAATVSLVRFTDSGRGKLLADGSIDPAYVDAKSWAVVFSDIELVHAVGGPAGHADEGSEGPVTKMGTLVVFMDADTGNYLEALSYGGVWQSPVTPPEATNPVMVFTRR
jgi:hypothetical protein